ncbi:MAG: hypothetical protein WBN02_19150, partial [Sedimenticolaceae bacterium]
TWAPVAMAVRTTKDIGVKDFMAPSLGKVLIPVLVLNLCTSLADSLSLHGSRLRLWLTDSLRRDRICSQNHLATARNGSQDDKRYWSKGFHGSLLGKCIDPCSYAHIGLDAGHCENTIDGKAAA